MNQFKFILPILLAISLVCCGPSEEEKTAQQEKVEKALPGCVIHDLGDFHTSEGHWVPIVVITCDGHQTTSFNSEYQSGKTMRSVSTFLIQ